MVMYVCMYQDENVISTFDSILRLKVSDMSMEILFLNLAKSLQDQVLKDLSLRYVTPYLVDITLSGGLKMLADSLTIVLLSKTL